MNAKTKIEISGNNSETVLNRIKREREEARNKRGKFFSGLFLRFRLFFYDRVVRRAARVIDERQLVEKRSTELADNKAQEEAKELVRSRRRARWTLAAAMVAGTADVLFVLPGIAYSLASRFAGGDEPTTFEKIAAYGLLEIALIFLLLAVKTLSNPQPHLDVIHSTGDDAAFGAAKRKLFGARVALVSYVALISMVVFLNVAAESGKILYGREILQTLQHTDTTQGTEAAPSASQDDTPAWIPKAMSGFAIPITAGVMVIIWGLHVCILFTKPGEFGRRGLSEFTRSEVDRLASKLAHAQRHSLLRLNGKLESVAANVTRLQSMLNRTPKLVKEELEKMMGKGFVVPNQDLPTDQSFGTAATAPIANRANGSKSLSPMPKSESAYALILSPASGKNGSHPAKSFDESEGNTLPW